MKSSETLSTALTQASSPEKGLYKKNTGFVWAKNEKDIVKPGDQVYVLKIPDTNYRRVRESIYYLPKPPGVSAPCFLFAYNNDYYRKSMLFSFYDSLGKAHTICNEVFSDKNNTQEAINQLFSKLTKNELWTLTPEQASFINGIFFYKRRRLYFEKNKRLFQVPSTLGNIDDSSDSVHYNQELSLEEKENFNNIMQEMQFPSLPYVVVLAEYRRVNEGRKILIRLTPVNLEEIESSEMIINNTIAIEKVIEHRPFAACLNLEYCSVYDWHETWDHIIGTLTVESVQLRLRALVAYFYCLFDFLYNLVNAVDSENACIDKKQRCRHIENFEENLRALQNEYSEYFPKMALHEAGNIAFITSEENIVLFEKVHADSPMVKKLALPGGLEHPTRDDELRYFSDVDDAAIARYNAMWKLLPFAADYPKFSPKDCWIHLFISDIESERAISKEKADKYDKSLSLILNSKIHRNSSLNTPNAFHSEVIDKLYLMRFTPSLEYIKKLQQALSPEVIAFWNNYTGCPKEHRHSPASVRITCASTYSLSIPPEFYGQLSSSPENINGYWLTLKNKPLRECLNPADFDYLHEMYALFSIWANNILNNNNFDVLSIEILELTKEHINRLDSILSGNNKNSQDMVINFLFQSTNDDEMLENLKEKYALNFVSFFKQQRDKRATSAVLYDINDFFWTKLQEEVYNLWKHWFNEKFSRYLEIQDNIMKILAKTLACVHTGQEMSIDYAQRKAYLKNAYMAGCLPSSPGCNIAILTTYFPEERWSASTKERLKALRQQAEDDVALTEALNQLRLYCLLRAERSTPSNNWSKSDKKGFYGGTIVPEGIESYSKNEENKRIALHNTNNKLSLSDTEDSRLNMNYNALVTRLEPLTECVDLEYLIKFNPSIQLLKYLYKKEWLKENIYNFYVNRCQSGLTSTDAPRLVSSQTFVLSLTEQESPFIFSSVRLRGFFKENDSTFGVFYRQTDEHLLEINPSQSKYLHEEYFARLKLIYNTLSSTETIKKSALFIAVLKATNIAIIDNILQELDSNKQQDILKVCFGNAEVVFQHLCFEYGLSFRNYLIRNPGISRGLLQLTFDELSSEDFFTIENDFQEAWNKRKESIINRFKEKKNECSSTLSLEEKNKNDRRRIANAGEHLISGVLFEPLYTKNSSVWIGPDTHLYPDIERKRLVEQNKGGNLISPFNRVLPVRAG